MSGSASWISARSAASISLRQPPRLSMRSSINAAAGGVDFDVLMDRKLSQLL